MANQDEAHLRTAAGRFYYAVLQRSRLSLEASGLYRSTGSSADHSGIARTLKQNKRWAAGDSLSQLQRLREHADYELSRTFGPDQCSQAAELAGNVVRLCSTEWDKDGVFET